MRKFIHFKIIFLGLKAFIVQIWTGKLNIHYFFYRNNSTFSHLSHFHGSNFKNNTNDDLNCLGYSKLSSSHIIGLAHYKAFIFFQTLEHHFQIKSQP